MHVNPILKQVLINGLLTHSAARGVKRGSTWLGYIVLAGGVGFVSLVYFSIAGYGLLMESFTAPTAAAMVGLVLLALSGMIVLIGYLSYKGKLSKPAPKSEGILDSMESTIQSLMGGLEGPIKDNPKTAMLLAALAGFTAGDRIN